MTNIVYLPSAEPPDDGDPEDRLPIKMPGRPPKRPPSVPDQPGKELVGPVYTGEIVDDDAADERPVPVDAPVVPASGPAWTREVQRQPLVPSWLVEPEERRKAVDWWVGNRAHAVKYHGVRSPVYAARFLGQAPVGAARAVGGAIRWARGMDLWDERDAAKAENKLTWLIQKRQERVQAALVVLPTVLVLGVALFLVTFWTRAWWDGPLLVLTLVLAASVKGRRRDKPIVSRAVVKPEEKPLRSEHVEAALRAIGIKDQVHFVAPIQTEGPGWRADLDLPEGATAAQVMDRRKELASALRRPLGAVWPGPDHEAHPGRLVLWVGRQPMEKVRAPVWPLLKAGAADLFGPVPFGHDQRLKPVLLTLVENNMLIGSLPGAGKTMSMRVALLAAALDPRVQLRLFELKGTGDLSPFEPVAHHYGAGPSDETLGECMASLREVHGMLESRAKTIRGLPRSVAPENKVTPALAGQPRLGLFPLVFAIDEAQEIYSHPEFGKEAADLSTAIIKRGRALGIILILATQRPDKDSLPTSISANVGIRFCLRVMGHTENDMVLGTGMHRNGIKATLFTVRDKGIGWLVGASEDPQIVRSSYIDGPMAEKVVERARAAREAAGTLSGYAVDEQEFDTGPDRTIVHDVLQVMGPDEDAVHSAELCARLAESWSARYAGWDATTLAMALKPCGVATKQVRAGEQGRNGRGVTRESLLDAIGEPRAD